MLTRSTVAIVVLVFLLSGCAAVPSNVSMTVRPGAALPGAPVRVAVHGLVPRSSVTITASAADRRRTEWRSSARFTATDDGTVTLGQRSEGGGYTGRDRMGLFEFLHPRGTTTGALFVAQRGGYDVSLRAKVRGAVVATARTHRQDHGEVGVRKRDLRLGADGIYGEAFRPPHSGKRRPAVLVFGGSEGGIGGAIDNASLLAAHGYPTLALA